MSWLPNKKQLIAKLDAVNEAKDVIATIKVNVVAGENLNGDRTRAELRVWRNQLIETTAVARTMTTVVKDLSKSRGYV